MSGFSWPRAALILAVLALGITLGVVGSLVLGRTGPAALATPTSALLRIPVTTTAARIPETDPAATPRTSTPSNSTPSNSTPSTSTPSTATPNADPPRGSLVIQGVGDVNFDPVYITNFADHGYGYAFEGLEGILLDDDLTVANLECSPSALGTPVDKAFIFRCDPAALPVAAAHGIEVANLANNHGQDYGAEAMLDGRLNVAAAGIVPVGVGEDLAAASAPALFDLNGWRVAVLGMGGIVPSDAWIATDESAGMASGDDRDQMVSAVERASLQADLVVVSVHWGTELIIDPDPADRSAAEAMIAAGADAVFGHHPHRLGELEFIDSRPVFWTLGNFIWPRLSDPGATTAVARVMVSPAGRITACLIPAFIETSGQPVLQGDPDC